MPSEEQYRTYLEFHNSNWYCYWDTDSPPLRNRQVLQAWHISTDEGIWEFTYGKLKESLASGKFTESVHGLSSEVSAVDARNILAAAHCFIIGVESKYPV